MGVHMLQSWIFCPFLLLSLLENLEPLNSSGWNLRRVPVNQLPKTGSAQRSDKVAQDFILLVLLCFLEDGQGEFRGRRGRVAWLGCVGRED